MEEARSQNKTNIAPEERERGRVSDYSGRWHRARPKRSEMHTQTPASQLALRRRTMRLNFFQSYLSDTWWQASGYWTKKKEKVIAFPSLPPAPSPCKYSMWGPYINTRLGPVILTERGGGCIRMRFLLLAWYSTLCQVWLISLHTTQPWNVNRDRFGGRACIRSAGADEHARGGEWVFGFSLISILSVYSVSSLLEINPQEERQKPVGASNNLKDWGFLFWVLSA